MKLSEKAEFNRIINEIKSDSKSMKMKDFIQHGRVTTYDHCIRVAAISFWIAKKLKLNCNLDSLVKGAFLHDYYLYDWHDYKEAKLHGFHHPEVAMRNAFRDFGLTKKEANIIKSHMWPLTLRSVPASKEAVLVCIADKISSTKETLTER